jgi:hypothetical protein
MLTDLDYTSFLIAAIIHDYKHPGLTNGFLMNSRNEIAVNYNGKGYNYPRSIDFRKLSCRRGI